jgi:hypothetical protein
LISNRENATQSREIWTAASLSEQTVNGKSWCFARHIVLMGGSTIQVAVVFCAVDSSSRQMSKQILIRQKLLVLTLCVFLPGSAAFLWARLRADSTSPPVASFEMGGIRVSQPHIDLGTVWSDGQGIYREFEIQNVTGHAVQIESVQSDCGCTVPTALSTRIADRDFAKISVAFWPPPAANDQGMRFQRTISVVFLTANGEQTVPLSLTGFLAPDGSLRVSPVTVDVAGRSSDTDPVAVLHFKGLARVIASIPNTLILRAGSHQRIHVESLRSEQADQIATKDVSVFISGDPSSKIESWESTASFSPDEYSEGLTVRIRGRLSESLVASPRSLVLTDDLAGRDVDVHITSTSLSKALCPVIKTELPLTYELTRGPEGSVNVYSLRVRVVGKLAGDVDGVIEVQSNAKLVTSNSEMAKILIPVVIVHRRLADQQQQLVRNLHP